MRVLTTLRPTRVPCLHSGVESRRRLSDSISLEQPLEQSLSRAQSRRVNSVPPDEWCDLSFSSSRLLMQAILVCLKRDGIWWMQIITATVPTERYWAYCAFKESMAWSFNILNEEFGGLFLTRGTNGKYPQKCCRPMEMLLLACSPTHTPQPSWIFHGQGSLMRSPYAYPLVFDMQPR